MTIDPNDAPDGYKAMPEIIDGGCRGCAFQSQGEAVCRPFPCTETRRADGHWVIFVPEEEPNGCVHPKTPR